MSEIDMMDDKLDSICRDFKALGDKGRMMIVLFLLNGEQSVSSISEYLKLSQSATSHQLRILKDANIVKAIKKGKEIFYFLYDEHIKNIVNMSIEHLNCD